MSRRTFIQWCDFTFNPWRGCRKVSPGCVNCYIDRTPIFRVTKQKHEQRVESSEATRNAPHSWNKKPWICDICGTAQAKTDYPPGCPNCGNSPFHRARVFLGSLMDIFDDEVPIQWFADAMQVVFQCQELDFLLVTKRPKLFWVRLEELQDSMSDCEFKRWLCCWGNGQAPRNVWVIASAEDQPRLEERVPKLLEIPAVVHGLSCEPLLGPLDFSKCVPNSITTFTKGRIDWVIAGGESGPQARPCAVEWMRDIQAQCSAAGVAYFAKQLGGNLSDSDLDVCSRSSGISMHDKKGGDPTEWPADMRVRQWPEGARR